MMINVSGHSTHRCDQIAVASECRGGRGYVLQQGLRPIAPRKCLVSDVHVWILHTLGDRRSMLKMIPMFIIEDFSVDRGDYQGR